MRAIDRLKRDHKLLRAKLDVVESALRMGPDVWFVLREVCVTLSRQLQDHVRREEELMATCRQALPPTLLAELVAEHQDEPRHLQAINRLFVSERGESLGRIRPALAQVIAGLRRHMVEEEAELFPLLERTLAAQAQEDETAARQAPPYHVDEAMTVNRVVRQFPTTRRVFEQFFVNVTAEGCTCLDEVAWQHGMDARALLALLEGAISSCRRVTGMPRDEAAAGASSEAVTAER